MKRITVVDSHTGGEPTRVVVDGGPDLGGGTLAERRERFRMHHDGYRSAIVGEPRGSEAMVGALLCEPDTPSCAAGVIFFDNAGYLGMCGHGTIGLIVTLAHLGRIAPGAHRVDTPVGVVSAVLDGDGRVTIGNVPSFRHRKGVAVDVPGHGRVVGDVAWGGNWFFLVEHPGELSLDHVEALTDYTWRIRLALRAAAITGAGGEEIDHIELFGHSPNASADSRNFVLCPAVVYDRSPCGTGTSAKLACLYADGKLHPGQVWRQEGIVGSIFEGQMAIDPAHPGGVLPFITGTAHVVGETSLILDERDPFVHGIRRGAGRNG